MDERWFGHIGVIESIVNSFEIQSIQGLSVKLPVSQGHETGQWSQAHLQASGRSAVNFSFHKSKSNFLAFI